MTIIPPYLEKGDTIGIVCPAGYLPKEKAETCMRVLKEWGFKVKVGSTLGKQSGYFSGTDDERLADLQQMLDDKSVKAILCGRGGYGVGRIIDRLSFKNFKKHPKWIIGYSDITVLHSHIFTRLKVASLHSPMAAAFNDSEYKNEYIQSLHKVLIGEKPKYVCEVSPFNNNGDATGKLIGGNLSLLAHLIGTASDIDTKGRILFLEDVGEYIYNTDRMLHQLKRNGKFEELNGLIIGSFSEMKDTVIPFGKEIYEVIFEVIKEYNYPVCFNFPVGHTRENYVLKVGAEYKLHVGKKVVTLEEI
jgi:muramoyltetrapeptide carboxypeptidase